MIALLSVRVMTTVLSPTEVGSVALINTLVNFCVLFLISPIGTFVNRRLHNWHSSGRIKTYFGWYAVYLLCVASLSSPLAMYAAYTGWLPIEVGLMPFGLIVWCSILFGTIHQTLIPSLNLLGRDKEFAVLSVISAGLGLCLSVLIIRVGGQPKATQWLAGVVLSQLVFSFVSAKVFFKDDTSKLNLLLRPNDAMVKTAWKFAWPVSIAVTCSWLHFQGYRFVLVNSVGLKELGYFFAGYGVAGSLFAALEQILTTWFTPRFFRQMNQTSGEVSDSAWRTYAGSVLPISLLALVALVSMSDLIVRVMLGPAFQNAQIFVRWGALAEWTRVVAGVYALIAHQRMYTRDLILPHFIGALSSFLIISLLVNSGKLTLVPLGLTIGNVLVIFILRWIQGDAARLGAKVTKLIILSAMLSLFVTGFDGLLFWTGCSWWLEQTAVRVSTLFIMWLATGVYLLWRVAVRN